MTSNSAEALNALLQEGMKAMAILASPTQVELLVSYVQLLARWNQTYNLTAIRDPREMVVKHILDSLTILPHITGPSLVDLGTGPGLPGIPVAIMRPDIQVVLVESNGKKARFLRECARSLPLANARVCEVRAEAGDPTGARHAQVTARALTALPELAEYATHWLAEGGELLAMKGPSVTEELKTLDPKFVVRARHDLLMPNLSASGLAKVGSVATEHCLLVIAPNA